MQDNIHLVTSNRARGIYDRTLNIIQSSHIRETVHRILNIPLNVFMEFTSDLPRERFQLSDFNIGMSPPMTSQNELFFCKLYIN